MFQRVCRVFRAVFQLTTPENTITYLNPLCLSPQNFAQALSSVSLGSWNGAKRKWKQCLRKILWWQTKRIKVCYGILWSGQLKCFSKNTTSPLEHLKPCLKRFPVLNKGWRIYRKGHVRTTMYLSFHCDTAIQNCFGAKRDLGLNSISDNRTSINFSFLFYLNRNPGDLNLFACFC